MLMEACTGKTTIMIINIINITPVTKSSSWLLPISIINCRPGQHHIFIGGQNGPEVVLEKGHLVCCGCVGWAALVAGVVIVVGDGLCHGRVGKVGRA